MIWGLFQVLYLVKWPIFHAFSGLESNSWHLGRNFFGKFVAKFCHRNKLFCTLLWYLALETQKYPKSKILDFPILERMKPKKRNDRFQKIMISGFLVQDIMKVYKISYFGDKIWQQICQKSFFLSVTCWTLNLISEVILDQKTYVSVLLIFEPNQLPLQHQATILVFFSMIPFNFEKCEWFFMN